MANRHRIVVGIARVENCYGGPEEGGWYYDAGQPVGSFKVFFREESAHAYRDYLREVISGRECPGVGVGGCGDDDGMSRGEAVDSGLKVVVQYGRVGDRGGLQAWPEVTPRYS